MDTGAFKRGWGGHGIPLNEIDNDPTPPYDASGPPPDQKQFAPALHCAHVSKDGLVYVCERGSDRIQVFTKQGKFVTSFFVHPSTQSRGPHCGGIWGPQILPAAPFTIWPFARSAAKIPAGGRWHQQHGVDSESQRRERSWDRSEAMAATQGNCTGSTRSRSIPKATSIPAKWKTASAFRSSS